MLIGGGVAVIVAILIGYPVFRLKGHYFAISTFAVAEIAERLFANWDFVEGAIGLPAPVLPEGLVNFMWYKTKMPYFYIAFVLFVAFSSWFTGRPVRVWDFTCVRSSRVTKPPKDWG